MSIGYIKPDNKQSIDTTETNWAKAKNIAKVRGYGDNGKYISDIFKTMIKNDVEVCCKPNGPRSSEIYTRKISRPFSKTSCGTLSRTSLAFIWRIAKRDSKAGILISTIIP